MSAAVIILLIVAAIAALGAVAITIRKRLQERAHKTTVAREREVQRRVKAAPLRTMLPTLDGRNTFVTVRPTSGDTLPSEAMDKLKKYIAQLPARDIHRKLRVEYRDNEWHRADEAVELASWEPPISKA